MDAVAEAGSELTHNHTFNLKVMMLHILEQAEHVEHCTTLFVLTHDKDRSDPEFNWMNASLLNILARLDTEVFNDETKDDGEGRKPGAKETRGLIYIDLRDCPGWDSKRLPHQWSQVMWAIAALYDFGETKDIAGLDIDIAFVCLGNRRDVLHRLIRPIRRMPNMNGPVAMATVCEPVAPCNAGSWLLPFLRA